MIARPNNVHSPGAQPATAADSAPVIARCGLGMWVLLATILVGCAAAFIFPAIRHAQRTGMVVSDVSNLKQLWTMQAGYAAQFGGPGKLMPSATGADFWLALTRTSPPLIDATLGDLFDCPLSPTVGGITHCEYRGPASDVNLYGDGDPVGACDHGDEGIVVIRKSGDAMLYKRDDPVARAALEKTRP